MNDSICWIQTIGYQQADSALTAIYNSVRTPQGDLDNLYQAFSLRGHTIKPADDLYLAALHHGQNTLPKQLAELLGTYVAILTDCDYAYTHHSHNYIHLHGDRAQAEMRLAALREKPLVHSGQDPETAALRYVRKLTLSPGDINEQDISDLRHAGWADGEIMEIVQIVAMFSYFVRVINGVGVSMTGEKIGRY